MICEHCMSKQATVHMQQFINGEKSETHLCADCAALQREMTISFDDFFQGFLDNFLTQQPQRQSQVPQCPRCGLTYPQFKNSGRLGCASCYTTFRAELENIFKNVQASNTHQGKFPEKSGARLMAQRRLDEMKKALRRAVEREAFEEAARLRDEIRRLEAQESNSQENEGGEL